MNEFAWSHFLHLAERLLLTSGEAAERSAISRAYYFAFHSARERALERGLTLVAGEPSHQQVWRFYTESPDIDCKQIGVNGDRLRGRRNKADYDLPYRGRISDEATQTVLEARSFPGQLASLNPRLPSR